jgi:hypothetical protein
MGNMPYSYILPHPFNSEVDDKKLFVGRIVALLG